MVVLTRNLAIANERYVQMHIHIIKGIHFKEKQNLFKSATICFIAKISLIKPIRHSIQQK